MFEILKQKDIFFDLTVYEKIGINFSHVYGQGNGQD